MEMKVAVIAGLLAFALFFIASVIQAALSSGQIDFWAHWQFEGPAVHNDTRVFPDWSTPLYPVTLTLLSWNYAVLSASFTPSAVNSFFASDALEHSLYYLELLAGALLSAAFVFRKRDPPRSTWVVASIVTALSTAAAIAVLSPLANWGSGALRLELGGAVVDAADLLMVFVFALLLSLAGFLTYAAIRHALKARRSHH